ncbi:MAG: FKBP-type peptidyl-prolyl cis-trans isomerase, partial [Chitinispirillales bacterium]|nr:FKBP-type peptidyl-prolyl cis-trans isomerase [Chitinispirillales bacterium]
MKISANKFVSVSYDLHVGEEDERELMERATVERPLQFIFGTDAMLPAFEAALNGLDAGAAFQFTLTPDNAYGAYSEESVVELPKNLFEVEGKFDSEYIKEGNTIPMMD